MKCVDITGDRPRRPANEIFSIKRIDFNSASLDHLQGVLRTSACIKDGYPRQNARFLLLSTNLAREGLQIDTDLLRIIAGTDDELSVGYTNIDDLGRP